MQAVDNVHPRAFAWSDLIPGAEPLPTTPPDADHHDADVEPEDIFMLSPPPMAWPRVFPGL